MVEHTLGKGGVESPILFSGTIKKGTLFSVPFLMVSQEADFRGEIAKQSGKSGIDLAEQKRRGGGD